jgi:hypothetical protein
VSENNDRKEGDPVSALDFTNSRLSGNGETVRAPLYIVDLIRTFPDRKARK